MQTTLAIKIAKGLHISLELKSPIAPKISIVFVKSRFFWMDSILIICCFRIVIAVFSFYSSTILKFKNLALWFLLPPHLNIVFILFNNNFFNNRPSRLLFCYFNSYGLYGFAVDFCCCYTKFIKSRHFMKRRAIFRY